MKRLFTLIAFVGFSLPALSQKASIYFSVGYGQYNMEDVKAYQHEFLEQSIVEGKVTDDFPAFVNYNLAYSRKMSDRWVFSSKLSYQSTGGRIAYRDYSGTYKADNVIKGHGLSFSFQYLLYEMGTWNFYFNTEFGGIYTKLIEATKIETSLGSRTRTYKYDGFSGSSQLGFVVNKEFELFYLGLDAGYFIDGRTNLKWYTEDLLLEDGTAVQSNWSGLRAQLKVGVKLQTLLGWVRREE